MARFSILVASFALLCVNNRVTSAPLVIKFEHNDMDQISKFLDQQSSNQHSAEYHQPQADENDAHAPKCGYESCNPGSPKMLNVHIVPHTHDDVGWLKTVDQYFYGARNDIQHAGVQYILDTVAAALNNDPAKKFIYVEIAFFYRWWREQGDFLRHSVKKLVNEGRLEFILGGWCMDDEAATHYNAIIDQHTLGFKFLELNFGECGRPKIGWQIDPFGHSREQASLFAQFGFDGLFFGRLDYQDKDMRLKSKTMEHMWMASSNLGDQASLLTGVNYNMYQQPDTFCFDVECSDTPIMVGNVANLLKLKSDDASALFTGVLKDGYGPPPSLINAQGLEPFMDDPRLEDYNVPDRVNDFIKAAKDQAQYYTTNHIMMTMGSDFQFENAHENYKNLDKLIKYVNMMQVNGSQVNLFYSTPSCYLYALNKANKTYTTKSDDFFPYASRGHTFWTGYFTSRPALKGYVRQCNNFLQVCKQMDALAQLEVEYGSDLKMDVFRQAMGVAQHHDAVSGTEKQHVSDDYAKRLSKGHSECEDVINYAYGKLMPLDKSQKIFTQQFCGFLNVSKCPVTETSNRFTVTIYNPIGRAYNYWVRVPVTGGSYTVLDPKLKSVTSEVMPVSEETKAVPAYNGSKATGELLFSASLQPLGFSTFFVLENKAPSTGKKVTPVIAGTTKPKDSLLHLSLTFSETTGLLKEMRNLDKSISVAVSQSLMYYMSAAGNNSKDIFQASGAYAFRPNGSQPIAIVSSPTNKIVNGKMVQEVHQVFSNWASQVIRLYAGEKYAEFEWTVGPIPYKDKLGREVISRFTTELETAATFYTDSNGREVLKRVRDFRPTWHLNQTEEVAGNYYPVNSRIFIRDEKKDVQFTVLTDRSQGGGSITDGQLELMVHRRLFYDDSFGVGEPLNETGINGNGLVVRGKHYVCLDTMGDSGKLHRDLAEKIFMAPALSFAENSLSPGDYLKKYRSQWSGLKTPLPDNVHLLTLEQWHSNTYLFRLEHFYEKTDDSVLSKPVTVQLKDLFAPFNIKSVVEYTLGGNQKLSEAKRLQWNVQGRMTNGDMSSFVKPVDPTTMAVELEPMQIRTFRVTLA